MEPTHPDRLVENVTAPSAGGFPDGDEEGRLGKRLPFRTTSSMKRWDQNRARTELIQLSPLPCSKVGLGSCSLMAGEPARALTGYGARGEGSGGLEGRSRDWGGIAWNAVN